MRPAADILNDLDAVDRSGAEHPWCRPRDAAVLMILDRSGDALRVLMGRRHLRHRFMPGAWVFPGGRVDAADSRVRFAEALPAALLAQLMVEMKGPKTVARAHAFAAAAIRETYEEAGVLVGRPTAPENSDHDPNDWAAAVRAHGIAPAVEALRFVARAITPPGRPRRFDTRFFAVPATAIGGRLASGVGPSGELEDVAWVTFAEARARPELAPITRAVLDELDNRLTADPDLVGSAPVPFYRWVRGRFVRTEIDA